jgi:hypothetical protein
MRSNSLIMIMNLINEVMPLIYAPLSIKSPIFAHLIFKISHVSELIFYSISVSLINTFFFYFQRE